jgi:hypothetical protein
MTVIVSGLFQAEIKNFGKSPKLSGFTPRIRDSYDVEYRVSCQHANAYQAAAQTGCMLPAFMV